MSDFKLQCEPAEKLLFASKKLGEESVNTTMKVTNTTKERVVYKVKCTSNEMFRIRPPVGALKPGENVTVTLSFNPSKTIPESSKHYFAVYYLNAKDEKVVPRKVWQEHKGEPDGTKKLFVDFKKEDEGGEKKDEEKKEEKKEDKKEDEKKEDKKEEKKDEKKEEKKDDKKSDDKKEEKKEEKKDEKKDDKKDEEKE